MTTFTSSIECSLNPSSAYISKLYYSASSYFASLNVSNPSSSSSPDLTLSD
jgi:hypothetical protein